MMTRRFRVPMRRNLVVGLAPTRLMRLVRALGGIQFLAHQRTAVAVPHRLLDTQPVALADGTAGQVNRVGLAGRACVRAGRRRMGPLMVRGGGRATYRLRAMMRGTRVVTGRRR